MKDNLIIKRISDIIIKLNNMIQENKKTLELIRNDISELYFKLNNNLNQKFDELKFNQNKMMKQQQQMNMNMQKQVSQNKLMQSVQIQSKMNNINIIFRTENSIIIEIKCSPSHKVYEIIEEYRRISGDYSENTKFIFNAKSLVKGLTVAEAGLTNNSNIFVVKAIPVGEKMGVFFRTRDYKDKPYIINVQCSSDEKVSDIILRYREKSGDYDENRKFVFNAKNLLKSLTAAEVGLNNSAHIFVI
jgi:hypothetical protein